MSKIKYIRNFSLIAHIDHGKSTLADAIIRHLINGDGKKINDQHLDSMKVEKKHGVTIKSNHIQLKYHAKNKHIYHFCLIDTPGHVDFNYEVHRSLKISDGALLIVDATQGVQAQTLSNIDIALENNLLILPVINKIDLTNANVEHTKKEIQELTGLDTSNCLPISAKQNINIDLLLELIVNKIPPPKDYSDKDLQILIFDSYYDPFNKVVIYGKVISGNVEKNMQIKFKSTNDIAIIAKIFYKEEKVIELNSLSCGEIGIFITNLKDIDKVQIGDTIIERNKNTKALTPFKKQQPIIFAGFFPINATEYDKLKFSFEKIKLTDDSFVYQSDFSEKLGQGFLCGFLGSFHMEILKERLETEYNVSIITALPSVKYKIVLKNNKSYYINIPSKYPDPGQLKTILEPYCLTEIYIPQKYYGKLLQYTIFKRGTLQNLKVINEKIYFVEFSMPLSELINNYYSELKSLSNGLASLNYKITHYQENKLICLNILLNNVIIPPLSLIVHKDKAYLYGNKICEELKNLIPRHTFTIIIQAAIGKTKIIARSSIKCLRKNVTAKLYGGDVTRKMKLLEKQKQGKARMKQFGKVNIPNNVFLQLAKLKV